MTPEAPTLLLVNPAARRGAAAFPTLRRQLAGRLNLVDAAVPDGAERLLAHIDDAVGRGMRRVIVAGGDGTLSQVAERLAGTGVALGVLPWGSGNTFASGVGLPLRWPVLLDVLASGQVRAFDVGIAECIYGRRAFLNSMTLGVSQRLAMLLSRSAKRRLGRLAWPFATLRALRATPRIRVALAYGPGEVDTFETLQLIVANGRALAGPVPATPTASGLDGRLEVFSLGTASARGLLRQAALTVLGRHVRDPASHYRACADVEVACEPAVALDVDGEIWGRTPVVCRVQPGVLDVLVPPAPPGGRSRIPPPPR